MFKSKNNNPGKSIPQDQICADDIEKLLIRGPLLSANVKVVKQYLPFIAPLSLDYYVSGSVRNLKEEALFAEFFSRITKIKANYETLHKQTTPDVKLVEMHRDQVVGLAKEYCKRARVENVSEVLFPPLETIANNIASREVVLKYNLFTTRKSYGTC